MDDLETPGRWNAALEWRGEEAVRAILLHSASSPRALVRLHAAGIDDPPREFVEEWLRRKAAFARAQNRQRMQIIAGISFLAAIVAVILGWPTIKDWFPI